MAGTDGLKELLKISKVSVIALGSGEDVINVGIGSWNCCKVCRNDVLKKCRGNFETLGQETELEFAEFTAESSYVT